MQIFKIDELKAQLEDINEKIENIEVSGGSGTGSSVAIDEQELNELLADILG